MRTLLFFSGPYDGITIHTTLTDEFLWIDGKRCYRAAGKKKALYRRMKRGRKLDEIIYEFVGLRVVLCCGVYHKRGDARHCAVCGELLEPSVSAED